MRKLTKADQAKLREISIMMTQRWQYGFEAEMHRLNKQVDDILDGVKTKDSNICLKGGNAVYPNGPKTIAVIRYREDSP